MVGVWKIFMLVIFTDKYQKQPQNCVQLGADQKGLGLYSIHILRDWYSPPVTYFMPGQILLSILACVQHTFKFNSILLTYSQSSLSLYVYFLYAFCTHMSRAWVKKWTNKWKNSYLCVCLPTCIKFTVCSVPEQVGKIWTETCLSQHAALLLIQIFVDQCSHCM